MNHDSKPHWATNPMSEHGEKTRPYWVEPSEVPYAPGRFRIQKGIEKGLSKAAKRGVEALKLTEPIKPKFRPMGTNELQFPPRRNSIIDEEDD